MPGPRRRRRLISPLTRRILPVNITALVILAAGIVHLADYRRDLVAAETAVLRARAEILAKALAEGPGVPEQARERIFERFYSQRPESDRRVGHSGLGLSIVRRIVDAFGGSVSAENRHGAAGTTVGARFVVSLTSHHAVDRPAAEGQASTA